MTREIKFRAWLLKENAMVTVDSLHNNKGYGGALEIIIDNPLFDPLKKHWTGDNRPSDSYLNHTLDIHKDRSEGDDFILMQQTGSKDKNNNPIYEGDIVSVQIPLGGFWGDTPNKKVAKIRYNDETARFIAEWEWSKNQHHIDLSCDLEIEIVGNIYEHPNLLK